ncbi:VOC family protein [Limimaricola pyoseonensis]|uniref:Catechol 2,3-dioxygenase n=1 Tax=Limimaricola pyoseonensis TaxID=521013 RepID=A0A1G7F4K7_9RHOB|nr:VOC family protein [Limimaricola pyoseonensis]SDE70890.1 Catechol 2,3-dioxygenase [Limimaricola pyoseonensis]
MTPRITAIDHLVLTVSDVAETVDFYVAVLGMAPVWSSGAAGERRAALRFGGQMIELHASEAPVPPHARHPGTGCIDLCLLTEAPMSHWLEHLDDLGVPVESGPDRREGANGPVASLSIRDPDGNLVEIAARL